MNDRRKELIKQYKERKIVGGIYRIMNTVNGQFYLNKTKDMQGAKNMFQSYYAMGMCAHPRLAKAWKEYGEEAFTFEVLEYWEKDAEQTECEFEKDLAELYEIWDAKLPRENRY